MDLTSFKQTVKYEDMFSLLEQKKKLQAGETGVHFFYLFLAKVQ